MWCGEVKLEWWGHGIGEAIVFVLDNMSSRGYRHNQQLDIHAFCNRGYGYRFTYSSWGRWSCCHLFQGQDGSIGLAPLYILRDTMMVWVASKQSLQKNAELLLLPKKALFHRALSMSVHFVKWWFVCCFVKGFVLFWHASPCILSVLRFVYSKMSATRVQLSMIRLLHRQRIPAPSLGLN